MTVSKDKEALRYLLNISDEHDRPRTQLRTVLDKTTNTKGETNRVILERLYKTLIEGE